MGRNFELGGNIFFADTGEYVRADEVISEGGPKGTAINAVTPAVHRLDEIDLEPTAWQADAACRGMNVDLFFGDDPATREMAALICEDCPVRSQCLTYAKDNKEQGTWGGEYRGTKAA